MLYSAANNAVLYPNPAEPARILACLPEACALQQHVVVPCTLHAMSVMRQLGFPVISPILHNYDWPGRYKPFDHQRHMAAFLTLHPRAFNLSDMGTGKTLAVLWALDYLMKQGVVKKALILSPLSTIYRVWEDEIFKNFLSDRSVSILYGDRAKRMAQVSKDADFYVVNHDGLGVGSTRSNRGMQLGELARYIKENKDINAVVVDEGSVYKDSSTNRYKILRHTLAEKPIVWWLTGTPVPVDPTNAWAQARAVRLDYAESLTSYRERTMYRVSQFKWVPKTGSAEIAAGILQPAIRYKRDDCLDLPECMVETRDVEMSATQKKAYEDLKRQLRVEIGAGQITAINEATLRLKLIQIACGAVYGPEHEVHKIDAGSRIEELRRVIEECNYKLLVFAPLTSVINLLYNELKKDYSVERITGDVSAKKRAEIFSAFQEKEDPRIIVADPRTMAHGLTLTAASAIVWYGPTDQPEIYQQANARINRPGQKNSMLVVRLAASPVEREIYRRLDSRESMQGLILNIVTGE